MAEITVQFRIDEMTLEALRAKAVLEDCDPETLIKDVVQRDLYWRGRRPAAPSITPDKAEYLRSCFAMDLQDTTGWDDLAARLKAKGYELREASGGLALYRLDENACVCTSTAIGCGHAALTKRFGAAFPGNKERQQLAYARACAGLHWAEA